LQKTVLDLAGNNIQYLSPKAIENLMFFLDRCHQPRSEDIEIINELMGSITTSEHVMKGEIRDHLLILSLLNKYGLDHNVLI
jgi:hypothetical protein